LSGDPGRQEDRARLDRDFFAEAEEILDRLMADVAPGRGPAHAEPDTVARMFREVHSLKGLAASLDHASVARVAHALEDLLGGLRQGRLQPDGTLRSLLEEGIDLLGAAVRQARSGGDPAVPRGDWEIRVAQRVAAGSTPEGSREVLGELPGFVTACLSQAEEDLLSREAAAGRSVLLLHVVYPVADFYERIRALHAAIAPPTTLIATVPEPPPGAAGDEPTRVRFCLVLTVVPGAGLPPESVVGEGHRYETVAVTRRAGRRAEDEAGEVRGVSEAIRVPVARLDTLTERVGDLSPTLGALRSAVAALRRDRPADRAARELDRLARTLATRLAAAQRSAIETRLVPLHQVFARLARLAARAAGDAGREVEFETRGGATEIDKQVVDDLAAPLVHLVRNAVGHGIEPPADREAAGKPRRGRIVVGARTLAGQVQVEIEDDGRGVQPARVAEAATRAGIPLPSCPLSAEEARELLFLPGFSTAVKVSELSGRGVGLDAVRRSIRRLRGSVELRSRPGQGTTVLLTLPISLALLQTLVVRSGRRRFAIPLSAVQESLRIDPARLGRREGRLEYDHPRGRIPIRDLQEFGAPAGTGPRNYAVVAGQPGRTIGILVEELLGRQEIVLRPLGRAFPETAGVAGATDLGDAGAVLVLDPEGLLNGQPHDRPAV
jgi:two-component system chemotaxis sensor kinase CheA